MSAPGPTPSSRRNPGPRSSAGSRRTSTADPPPASPVRGPDWPRCSARAAAWCGRSARRSPLRPSRPGSTSAGTAPRPPPGSGDRRCPRRRPAGNRRSAAPGRTRSAGPRRPPGSTCPASPTCWCPWRPSFGTPASVSRSTRRGAASPGRGLRATGSACGSWCRQAGSPHAPPGRSLAARRPGPCPAGTRRRRDRPPAASRRRWPARRARSSPCACR